MIGADAPDFSADFAVNGKPARLRDLRGKVLLLYFWEVRSSTAAALLPRLAEWHKAHQANGLAIVGLTFYTSDIDQKLTFDKDRVLSTRIGVDPRDPKVRQFAIDFGGPKLKRFSEANRPQAIASCSDNAGIPYSQVYYNKFNDSWRVVLKLEPKADNKDPIDIRCTLQKGEEVLTETWTYHWSPP